MDNNVTVLGIDLAKDVFQLHGSNAKGKVVLIKKIRSRTTFARFIANLPPCLIGMEACGSAHHWARLFLSYGHTLKLMHPGYVKAYVQRNKTDAADAKAIHEAVTREVIHAVPVKTKEQQAILMLHKLRNRLVSSRTRLSNQLRGCLYEFGITLPQGKAALLREVPSILENAENGLPDLMRRLVNDLLEEFIELTEKIKKYMLEIESLAKSDEGAKRLQTIPGIGPITATAFKATFVGYGFDKGRKAAAIIGLTPREHSSGSSRRLGSISKQGNRYLRYLLVHGARAVVNSSANKADKLSLWVQNLVAKRGYNKAVVALANKNARQAWAILNTGSEYQAEFAENYHGAQAA